MRRITYKDLEKALVMQEEVICNSVKTSWCEDGLFLVCSYNTAIAYCLHDMWHLNEEFYSKTTTKVQNAVKNIAQVYTGYSKESYFNGALINATTK